MTTDLSSTQLEEMFDAARDLILGYRLGRLSAPHVNVDDSQTFREFIVGLLAERYPQASRELLRSMVERELHSPTTRLA
jgi:hypothetical protein